MIIVISHDQDPHASRVLERLSSAGREALLLNLAELPNHATLTFSYLCCGKVRIDYRRGKGASFALDQARSVWWRRPQAADPSSVTDPDLRLFTANEWNEAINGLWQLLRMPWMNDPMRDDVASRKALQLKIAQEVGLRVPRTLITSDPEQARAFIASQGIGATIHKTFSCTHAVWRETRLLRGEDLDLLDSVQLAPVIFQEFVPAGLDLRITAVGESLFAAAIRPEDGETRVDFRMRVGRSSMTAFDLPDVIARKLRALMDRLGLIYGAIDMRVTPEGEYYFLEVNTAGEFLFVEDRTGLPISHAVAQWLAQPRLAADARPH
jgi:glutathione synthase/RimK-type ligase-like ATP-grasp enzyme